MLPKLRLIRRKENLVLVPLGGGNSWTGRLEYHGECSEVRRRRDPAGFGVERYCRLGERNPFILEKPAAP